MSKCPKEMLLRVKTQVLQSSFFVTLSPVQYEGIPKKSNARPLRVWVGGGPNNKDVQNSKQ